MGNKMLEIKKKVETKKLREDQLIRRLFRMEEEKKQILRNMDPFKRATIIR